MSTSPIVVDMPYQPRWADAWSYPEYFRGITAKRVVAYLLDLLVVGLLGAVLWVLGGLMSVFSFGILAPVGTLLLAILPLAYHSLFIASRRSATIGMRVMGLRVMSLSPQRAAWGGRPDLFQAMIQTVAFYGSLATTGSLILLIALFNPRRRTLHDWLAGTVVVNDLSPIQDIG
ncbi:MAG TPA: RDD family protein [Magnetospirillum sp.]|nr:RDD family protein [Magnetospirillum sp.]